jgi:N-acetylglucosamine-6-phosphate deacetylase
VNLIQTFNNGISDVTQCYGEDLSNVAIVTLAPELEKSSEVIRDLVSRGIKVSVGVYQVNFMKICFLKIKNRSPTHIVKILFIG